MSLAALDEAIDGLDLAVDARVLAGALRSLDRLTAKVTAVVGEFAAADLWAVEGATSMTAWLRDRGAMAGRDARAMARTATRLQACPVTARAWRDGGLSGGHVQAVVGNLTDATAGLYAEHEAELVPVLAALDVAEAAAAMRSWRLHADAVLDDGGLGGEPRRVLHHGRTLEGRSAMNGSFDAEGAAVIDTALRLAATDDDPLAGDRVRVAAERRGDALVDVCRWYLDHQAGRRGGRHRPHLNVVVDLDALPGQGHLVDGTPLDGLTIERLLCDAGVHRVVTRGRSQALDYGRTTRTISPALWAALVIRDRHCRAPGCDRHPEWSEAHHVRPWQAGGSTDLGNLVLLCARHHHVFHQPGYVLTLGPDARLEVRDPRGHLRTTDPPTTTHWTPPTPAHTRQPVPAGHGT